MDFKNRPIIMTCELYKSIMAVLEDSRWAIQGLLSKNCDCDKHDSEDSKEKNHIRNVIERINEIVG